MKILHINDTYKPIGGTETYLNNLIELQKKQGQEIYLMAIDDEIGFHNSRFFVYKDIYQRGLLKYFLWFFFNPILYINFKRWLKSINPEVVHIHNNGKFSLTILLALYKSKYWVIQTVHDCSMICPVAKYTPKPGIQCVGGFGFHCLKNKCISRERYFYEMLPHFIVSLFRKKVINQFISPSQFLKNELEKHGFNNVNFLPNFINTNDFEFNLNNMEDGVILFAGRLTEEKGIMQLIEAMSNIIKEIPSCRLDIIGEGPIKNKIIEKIHDLKIDDNAIVHGMMSQNNLFKYYQKSSIVVIPSIICENNPLVAFEAMASGRSLVATNLGGLSELVKSEFTGLLTKPMDIQNLSEQILKLLKDKKMTRQFGKNARQYIEIFNPINHYNQLIKIYQK